MRKMERMSATKSVKPAAIYFFFPSVHLVFSCTESSLLSIVLIKINAINVCILKARNNVEIFSSTDNVLFFSRTFCTLPKVCVSQFLKGEVSAKLTFEKHRLHKRGND